MRDRRAVPAVVLVLALLALSAGGADVTLQFDVLRAHSGDRVQDYLSRSVALGGDTNGDGLADVATYEHDWNGSWPKDTGVVRIFSGKDGSQLACYRNATEQNGFYGQEGLAFIPDLDSDGCDELAICYPRDDEKSSQTGRVDVISGATGERILVFYGDGGLEMFGTAVDAAGDVDGDGVADIVAGGSEARRDSKRVGLARVFSGADGSTIHSIYGTLDSSFGAAVAGAGDVDADGRDDFLVGAWSDNTAALRAGSASVFSGRDKAVLWQVFGEAAEEELGAAVAGLGDLDGDGCADFAVGAPGAGETGDTGRVEIFSGRTGASLGVLTGDAGGDRFGERIATIGDVNLDGVPDFAVGAPGNDAAGNAAGQVKLVSGADLRVLATLTGEAPNDAFGWSLGGGGGDVNGDGSPDFVIGSKAWSSGSFYGKAHVYTSAILESLIAIDDGAPFTVDRDVTLRLVRAGASWVEFRARNAADPWSDWSPFALRVPCTLTGGEGEKVVEAEFRTGEGTVGSLLTDSICLDLSAPSGSFAIEGGAAYTRNRTVTLTLDATDAGSGVGTFRIRHAGQSWGWWRALPENPTWWMGDEDGPYTVEVQYRDLVGNESPTYAASTTLDTTVPAGSFALGGGRGYLLGDEDVVLDVTASDNPQGSGLGGLRASWDGGLHWTDWVAFAESGTVVFPRPSVSGARVVRARVRDRALNEADIGSAETFFLWDYLPALSLFAKRTGPLAPDVSVQAFAVDLVAGDLFSAKVGARDPGGAAVPVALDLLAPDRERLVEERFPAGLKTPGIAGFPVPETGEYALVLRTGNGVSGTYSLALKVKQAKTNKGSKGTMAKGGVAFDAVGGSVLAASLKGEGLTAAAVSLEGPGGPMVWFAKQGKGSVKLLPVTLDQGTGTYRLSTVLPGPVTYKLSVKLPK